MPWRISFAIYFCEYCKIVAFKRYKQCRSHEKKCNQPKFIDHIFIGDHKYNQQMIASTSEIASSIATNVNPTSLVPTSTSMTSTTNTPSYTFAKEHMKQMEQHMYDMSLQNVVWNPNSNVILVKDVKKCWSGCDMCNDITDK